MALWKLDPAHTEIKFKARHLVVSTVTGYFNKFEGTVESDRADFADARISFEADVANINTNSQQRDTHHAFLLFPPQFTILIIICNPCLCIRCEPDHSACWPYNGCSRTSRHRFARTRSSHALVLRKCPHRLMFSFSSEGISSSSRRDTVIDDL